MRFERGWHGDGRGRHRVQRPGTRDRLPQIAADRLGVPMRAIRYVQADTAVISGAWPWRRALHAYGRHRGGEGDRCRARQGAGRSRPICCRRSRMSWHSPPGASRCAAPPAASRIVPAGGGGARSGQPAGRHDTGDRRRCEEHADVFTFPSGCHVAEVEIDPETGAVALLRYHGGRRLRPADQPAADRRPGAGRRGPGHRPGAAGEMVYEAGSGQLLIGSLHGLRPAAGRRPAGLRHRACVELPTRRTRWGEGRRARPAPSPRRRR